MMTSIRFMKNSFVPVLENFISLPAFLNEFFYTLNHMFIIFDWPYGSFGNRSHFSLWYWRFDFVESRELDMKAQKIFSHYILNSPRLDLAQLFSITIMNLPLDWIVLLPPLCLITLMMYLLFNNYWFSASI